MQRLIDALPIPLFYKDTQGRYEGCNSAFETITGYKKEEVVGSWEDCSTFHIFLPALDQKKLEDQKKKRKLFLGKGKILVMGDEPVIRSVAEEMLQNLGYEVYLAQDGTEAIEIYKEAFMLKMPFRAVILDLTVHGGLGGKETIQKLREIDPEVKAIVSSGYSNDSVVANYRDHGFADFILKPYEIAELSKKLFSI